MPSRAREIIAHVPVYELASQAVPDGNPLIQLGQNELRMVPSALAQQAAVHSTANLCAYPDPDHRALRERIAEVHGLNIERIVCGAGSMELMGLLANAYCEPGSNIVVSQYGYKFFELCCTLGGAEVRSVPEIDWRVDADAVAAAVDANTRLVFLVDPNNPTGARLPDGTLQNVRNSLPEHVMLVVDGAYAEFITDPDHDDGFAHVDAQANVVVLRTFSKAYGLAGQRVGWMYAPHDVVDVLLRIRPPNSVTATALACAEAAMSDRTHVQHVVSEVNRLREGFREWLGSRQISALPSDGNFVLVDFGTASEANRIYTGLISEGIVVRPMRGYGLTSSLRITIGSEAEMTRLTSRLEALQ